MAREFEHYDGCNHNDPANCAACALTDTRQEAPNYSAWPLAYMENHRPIPAKWRIAFWSEFDRTDNDLYVANLHKTHARHGARFTDGKSA